MKIDFQYIVCGLLLAGAIYYIYRTIRKSFKHEHDCPDCAVALPKQKVKKAFLKAE